MTTEFASERIPRLHAAARRIRELTPRFGGHMTSPDPQTEEQWDRGQVLSHVAELLPYWVEQVEQVVAAGGGGVAFGRVKATPSRLERIEGGRRLAPASALDQMDDGVGLAVALLGRLGDEQLAMVGRHQSLGDMTMARAIDEFLIDHLESHADQMAEQLA
ncbi:MAG: hypothetical protein ACRDZQ_00475 [Acidimicrobiales bacterium]